MRRESRRKIQKSKSTLENMILYIGSAVVILIVIMAAIFMYGKNSNKDMKNGSMDLEKIANIDKNDTNSANTTQSASTDIGKTVEESKNEIINNKNQVSTKSENKTDNTTSTNVKSNNTTSTNKSTTSVKSNSVNTSSNEPKQKTTVAKELSFQKPVDGDIVREYAKDNLIYSATLDEWTTHMGIDIKAEKTTVVKAAEEGTVKSIKNDPRYGLTIVIEHENNFQTVYSNLLTSEFVVEGEKVEKGQSLGTVGNTAVFEIADEPHLHFEILKDSLPVDPNIYIK